MDFGGNLGQMKYLKKSMCLSCEAHTANPGAGKADILTLRTPDFNESSSVREVQWFPVSPPSLSFYVQSLLESEH